MSGEGERLRYERTVRVGLRLLSATWRIRISADDTVPEGLLRGERSAVVAFWHAQMLPLWYLFRRARPAALVSASRDGELLARYLERALGYRRVIRGSSTRGGRDALQAAVDALRESSLLITPDGPLGPACQAKPGAAVAALRAGVPLVLAGWRARRVVRLRSWDRMAIPLPLARVEVRLCGFDLSALGARERIDDDVLAELAAELERLSGNAFTAAESSPIR